MSRRANVMLWEAIAIVAIVACTPAYAADVWPDCSFNCTAKDVTLASMFAVVSGGACEPGGTSTAQIYGRFSANAKRYAVILIADLHVEGGSTTHLASCAGDLSAGTTDVLLATVSWPCGSAITLGNIIVSWSASPETCSAATCSGRAAKCSSSQDLVVATPLVVNFTSNSPQCVGEPIAFTNASTGGASPFSYSWTFGDGATSSQANPSHVYAAAGTYTVSLTVRDRTGATDSHSYSVTALGLPTAAASNGGPYCPGNTISLFASGGASYAWTGPGGFTSSAQNPTIPSASSAKAGAYTVTIRNSGGCTAQASTTVVVDSTPPVVTAPGNVTAACGHSTSPAATGQATASDDSGTPPVVSYSDSPSLSGCSGTGTIARTWTATDACGNTASAIQTITVVDVTAPTLTAPLDVTVGCHDSILPGATGQATATDECSAPTITYADQANLSGCGGSGVITRTWRAMDACGNVATSTQTLTVVDLTAPALTVPHDVTVSCHDSTLPGATGQATATDPCSTPTVTYSDQASLNGCSSTGTIVRTWAATDACGNTSTGAQTITVVDLAAPTLTAPADITVSCHASTLPEATGQAIATDGCSAPVIIYSDQANLDGCSGSGTVARTWTAADACGNTASAVQTIAVVDNEPPHLTVPGSLTVHAGESTTPAGTGQATATDACSVPAVSHADVNALAADGTGTIARTWTAVDACGNTTSGIQVITVDSAPPTPHLTLTAPADVTVDVNESTDPSATGTPTVSDTCPTPPVVTHSDQADLTGCDGTGTIVRTWTATDSCGNTASAVQTIAVVDEGHVVLTVPADITIGAGEPTDPAATGWASASDPDAVDEPPVVTYADQVDLAGCDGTGTILRTWTATDECGNSVSAVQTIAVVDEGRILLTIPADVTVDAGQPTDPGATGWASASDPDAVDEPPTLTYLDQADLTGCDGTGTILRTWTATDGCGNATRGVQTIAVVDEGHILLTLPADIIVEAGEPTDPATTGWASASDPDTVGEPPVVTYADQVDLTGCDGTGTILRTWTATDECGNAESGLQIITVVDEGRVSLLVPPDATVACGHSYAPEATGWATASDPDAVDEAPEVTYMDDVNLSGCGGSGAVLRTWTGTDECGNAVSAVQTIAVVDLTPPTLAVPPDATVESGGSTEPLATGRAEATDLCSAVDVFHTDVEIAGSCAGTAAVLRTWTAVDACGNETSAVQRIDVADTTAPALTLPPDADVECGHSTSPAATGQATATDVASTPVVTYADRSLPGTCPGTATIERTWTATDACGNAATAVQNLAVVDSQAPQLTVPADEVVQVGDPVAPLFTGIATATDTCSAVRVTYSDEARLLPDGTGTILRLWTAADACGNAVRDTQTIAVTALPPPPHLSLVVPEDRTVDAGQPTDPVATGFAVASGTCPTPAVVTYADQVSLHGCDGTGTILRTWTATDACGNTASGIQTIAVVDVGHIVLVVPADTSASCGSPTAPEATGWASASDPDAVDEPPTVTYADEVLLDPCTGVGTILRTWTAADACGNAASAVQTLAVSGSCAARVVISEIAWAGTAADPAHEWIELQNLGDELVDLDGWSLRWRRAQPATPDEGWKTVALSGALAPAQRHAGVPLRVTAADPAVWWIDLGDVRPTPDYVLVERVTGDAVSDVRANVVFDNLPEGERKLELSDLGEIVQLVAPTGCVTDSANAEREGIGGWAAGDLATRGTMERTDPLQGDTDDNWHTNLGVVTHGEDEDGLDLVATAGARNQPPLGRLVDLAAIDIFPVARGASLEARLPQQAPLGDVRISRVVAAELGSDVPLPPPVDVSVADASLVVAASAAAPLGTYEVWVRVGTAAVLVPVRIDP